MRGLIVASVCIGSLAMAEPWIFEFGAAPNSKLLEDVQKRCQAEHVPTILGRGVLGRFARVENCVENSLAYFKRTLRSVEPVVVAKPLSLITPTSARPIGLDPLSRFQWYLTWQGHQVKRELTDLQSLVVSGAKDKILFSQPEAKAKTKTIVALVDSGVDLDHPELKDSILRNDAECVDGRLRPNPKDDLDQNGFVGDCMGWNFSTDSKRDQSRPYDNDGHGTHLAGLLAAKQDNNLGLSSLTDNVKILPLKVFDASSRGSGIFSDRVAQAISYATQRQVDVINLSLGWPLSQSTTHVRAALDEALAQGIVIVAASGNNSSEAPLLPCAYSGVICVGATGIDGERAPFSNFGPHVDIMVPGEAILSTIPMKLDPDHFSVNGFDYKSGTSQAAALTSAYVAWILGTEELSDSNRVLAVRRRLLRSTQSQEGSLMGALWTQSFPDHRNDLRWVPDAKRLLPVTLDEAPRLEIPFVDLETGRTGCPGQVLLDGQASHNCQWRFEVDSCTDARQRASLIWGSGYESSWVWEWQQEMSRVPHRKFHLPEGIKTLRSLTVPRWYQGPQRILGFSDDSSGATLMELDQDQLIIRAQLKIGPSVSRWVAIHFLPQTSFAGAALVSLTQERLSSGTWLAFTFWSPEGQIVDRWLYRPDRIVPPALDRVVWVESEEAGPVGRIPVFMGDSQQPLGCESPDPWERKAQNERRWFVKLLPKRVPNQAESELRTECVLAPGDKPAQWLALYPQSRSDFEQGLFRALYEEGLGFDARDSKKIQKIWTGLQIDSPSFQMPSTFLSAGLKAMGQSLEGLEIFNSRRVSWFESTLGRQLDFELPDSIHENFVHVTGIRSGQTPSLFLQSESRFWYLQWQGNDVQTASLPLDRVSFVSGQLARESIYWLPQETKDVFFVDASSLSSPSVYWIEGDADLADSPSIRKRAKLQLAVTKGCWVLNPPYMSGRDYIAFHCPDRENSIYLVDPTELSR